MSTWSKSKNSWGSKPAGASATGAAATGSTASTSTGSKWGTKSTTGSTGSKWGTNKTSTTTATASSPSNFIRGGSGTQWKENRKGEPTYIEQGLQLTNSINIPFATCQFKEISSNNTETVYELHNILYFGMFNHLNMITLRYNDYVMKGGIATHEWDKPQAQDASKTATTATTTNKFSFGKTGTTTGAKTGFGSTANPPKDVTPWIVDIDKSKNFGEIPQPPEVQKKPLGELEPPTITLSAPSKDPISKLKPIKKFTPRGITKKSSLFEDATKELPLNKSKTRDLENVSFVKIDSSSAQKNDHNTKTATALSKTMNSNQQSSMSVSYLGSTNSNFNTKEFNSFQTEINSENCYGAITKDEMTITFPMIPINIWNCIQANCETIINLHDNGKDKVLTIKMPKSKNSEDKEIPYIAFLNPQGENKFNIVQGKIHTNKDNEIILSK